MTCFLAGDVCPLFSIAAISLFLLGLVGVYAPSSMVAICLLRLKLVEFWTLLKLHFGIAWLQLTDGEHASFCMGTID